MKCQSNTSKEMSDYGARHYPGVTAHHTTDDCTVTPKMIKQRNKLQNNNPRSCDSSSKC